MPQIVAFWDVTPCSVEVGQYYTASQSRRPRYLQFSRHRRIFSVLRTISWSEFYRGPCIWVSSLQATMRHVPYTDALNQSCNTKNSWNANCELLSIHFQTHVFVLQNTSLCLYCAILSVSVLSFNYCGLKATWRFDVPSPCVTLLLLGYFIGDYDRNTGTQGDSRYRLPSRRAPLLLPN
jgi:hypothetical protein